jgi:hypothetical protein
LGDDFSQPAWLVSDGKAADATHMEIAPVNGLEVDGNGLLARVGIVDVTGTMRGQVRMAVLILGQLLPPVGGVRIGSE